MDYTKYHPLFEDWLSEAYPRGEYYYGLSSTDRDRYDKYTNGEYKDYRVQICFVAFIAGYELGVKDGKTNPRE